MSTSKTKPSKTPAPAPKLGIDLGTTNTLAAIVRNGHVEVLKNREGNTLTHSCVSFSEDTKELLVGTLASRKKATSYWNTIFDVKRLLGKSFDDESVKKFIEMHSFEMISVDKKPAIKVTHDGETVFLRPLEVSARVLTDIRECAEQKLRGRSNSGPMQITSAVITVPAYFQQAQKSETLKAAKIAGFTEVDLITEPTAAAFAYGYAEKRFDGYRLLVFDFGGGTFDVSVLEVQNGRFKVLKIEGDCNLGGRDLDEKLFEYCAEEIKRRWKKDCKSNPRIKQELLEMCEDLKIVLSTREEESVHLVKLFSDLYPASLQVTREKFEELVSPLLMRSISIVKLALTRSGFTPDEIDEVLMVGGVSRIPMVADLLITEVGFDEDKLNRSICEDEAVVNGAAVYAANLSGTLQTSIPISMVEVIPLSIGTNIISDVFSSMILRGSSIPCKRTEKYVTTVNDQDGMLFEIFEGERKIASKNNKLGQLRIDGLNPGMAGKVSVEATFEIDRNGILHVAAIHQDKKTEMEMTYEMRSGNEPDVEEALRDAKQHLESDTKEEVRAHAKSKLKMAVEQAKYQCESKSILARCEQYGKWLQSNKDASAELYQVMYDAFMSDER